MGIVTFFWLSYIPIAIISLVRFIKNRNVFVERDLRGFYGEIHIIFQITTRSATNTPVVRRGIQSIINSSKLLNYSNYKISVITDDESDILTLDEFKKCEVVVVKKDFKTSAIKKGRALQYAVEHRRATGENINKYWIFHMDDESYVTKQTILALLKFINQGNGVASEGPIFYPLKFESANRITAIAESIRPFACYDCVSQMTNPPPLHMHGSNLLVRSDVEDTIGWNFGPTLAEDQMFGYTVYERYGPGSMGWHGGILLEQPPLNMKDHFMQRRRWVLGSLQNMCKFSRMHRYKLMFKSITYFLGFISAMASTVLYFHNYLPQVFSIPNPEQLGAAISAHLVSWLDNLPTWFSPDSIAQPLININPVDVGISSLLFFTSIVWLSSYQIGLFLNLRYSGISWNKRVILHLQTLAFCPIIGLVETFPAFYAMFEFFIRKKTSRTHEIPVYDFYVVNK